MFSVNDLRHTCVFSDMLTDGIMGVEGGGRGERGRDEGGMRERERGG